MEVERIHKEVEAKTTDTRRLLSPCSIPLEGTEGQVLSKRVWRCNPVSDRIGTVR